MAKQSVRAASLRVGTSQDAKAVAIVAANASGDEIAVVFDADATEGLIVDLLHTLYGLPGGSVVQARSDAGTLESLPANQFVVALGETGGILSVLVGRARLNFRFPSTGSLRDFGRAAIEASDVLDRGNPTGPKH